MVKQHGLAPAGGIGTQFGWVRACGWKEGRGKSALGCECVCIKLLFARTWLVVACVHSQAGTLGNAFVAGKGWRQCTQGGHTIL